MDANVGECSTNASKLLTQLRSRSTMQPAMFTKILTLFLLLTGLGEQGIALCQAYAPSNTNRTSSTSTVIIAPHTTANNNCSKHSDCNPVLRNLLLLITGESEETNPRRQLQERRAFQSLHRNPKILCIKAQCQCGEEAKGRVTFDPVNQICRRRCEQDQDCLSDSGVLRQLGRSEPKMTREKEVDPLLNFAPGDDLNTVAQFCAPDHLCRCPESSQLDMLNQSRCIVETPPLLATSLTIGSIFILLTITAVPVWSMIRKHRDYLRQQQRLLPTSEKN